MVGPVPPGDRILRALAELWMLFPTEDQYREWFERAGFEDVELVTVAPDWYRDRRSRYAVAVSGRKPAAGPSPLALAGATEDLRAPMAACASGSCSPGASCSARWRARCSCRSGSRSRCARGWAGQVNRVAVAVPGRQAGRLGALWRFSRPHTVIGTTVSIVCLYLIAVDTLPGLGLGGRGCGTCSGRWSPGLAVNVYIVGVNQIEDVEIDRVNKPFLPLAAGDMTHEQARAIVGGDGRAWPSCSAVTQGAVGDGRGARRPRGRHGLLDAAAAPQALPGARLAVDLRRALGRGQPRRLRALLARVRRRDACRSRRRCGR